MNRMKHGLAATAVVLGALAAAPAAEAHFQLVYTPEVNVEKPGNLPMRLVFWHPMENGHVMDMGQPREFFVVTKDGKTDLLPALKPITFKGSENAAKAFAVDLPVKKNGDYVVAVVPAPYYEKGEDIFIQQIAKSYVNKGGLPTNWAEPLGLPTEIVPLNKPTNVLAGSTFSGVLLSEGKPVAGAEIEIEYIAATPDLKTNAAPAKTSVKAPAGGALVAVTDANGVFTFGIPKAGFWGFAALGTGPAKTHEGKELSQDAVIWVRAYDLK